MRQPRYIVSTTYHNKPDVEKRARHSNEDNEDFPSSEVLDILLVMLLDRIYFLIVYIANMTPKRSNRTTIIIEPAVRDTLKHIARKDQSYNALLLDLIKLHRENEARGLAQESEALKPGRSSQSPGPGGPVNYEY